MWRRAYFFIRGKRYIYWYTPSVILPWSAYAFAVMSCLMSSTSRSALLCPWHRVRVSFDEDEVLSLWFYFWLYHHEKRFFLDRVYQLKTSRVFLTDDASQITLHQASHSCNIIQTDFFIAYSSYIREVKQATLDTVRRWHKLSRIKTLNSSSHSEVIRPLISSRCRLLEGFA